MAVEDLRVRIKGVKNCSFDLELTEKTTLLGRSNQDLGLKDEKISRRHATILIDQCVGSVNLHRVSSNPTHVIGANGIKKEVKMDVPTPLTHKSIILLSNLCEILVEIEADDGTSQDLVATMIEEPSLLPESQEPQERVHMPVPKKTQVRATQVVEDRKRKEAAPPSNPQKKRKVVDLGPVEPSGPMDMSLCESMYDDSSLSPSPPPPKLHVPPTRRAPNSPQFATPSPVKAKPSPVKPNQQQARPSPYESPRAKQQQHGHSSPVPAQQQQQQQVPQDLSKASPSEFHFLKKVGSGACGEVYLAVVRGKKVAVKRVFRSLLSQDAFEDFEKEVGVLSRLNHPNVGLFKLLGSLVDQSKNMCIIFEFIERGSVYDALRDQETKWNPQLRWKIIHQTALGVGYLHNKNIIHRDLKCQNLLLGNGFVVKVTDFGLAKPLERDQTTAKTVCGTMPWIAPEVLQGGGYKYPADVYSFAMIIYEVLSHCEPFKGFTEAQIIIGVVKEHLRPKLPSHFSNPDPLTSAIIKMMWQCWNDEPGKRPTMQAAASSLEQSFSSLRL